MAMKFINRIADLTYRHLAETGQSPNCLYMGRDEKHDMLIWMREDVHWTHMPHQNPKAWEQDYRPELMGCKIYLVNAGSHLQVGTE